MLKVLFNLIFRALQRVHVYFFQQSFLVEPETYVYISLIRSSSSKTGKINNPNSIWGVGGGQNCHKI